MVAWSQRKLRVKLQSRTKLLENVFLLMRTTLRNKTVSKSMALRKIYNPFPQSKVASYKRPGIRLSFKDTTTLLPVGGGGKNCYSFDVEKNALQACNLIKFCPRLQVKQFYYIDTDEIPGVFLLLKNHIFIVCSEDTIFIFHVRGYQCYHGY